MLRKMRAEILFPDPNDMHPAIAELIERDYEVEFLDDWIDDESPAVWIMAWTLSEDDDLGFFHEICALANSLGGDVVEAGYADPEL